MNVAVTELELFSATVHAPVPEHAPAQPVKVDPLPGAAVRVTDVPVVKLALQVAPQLMPAGELLTVPVPVPALLTVSVCVAETELENVAVADRLLLTGTVQVPVPEQAPLQPAKVDPASATAVSVTEVPAVKLALQLVPQLMPDGELLTVPLPEPALTTARV